MVRAAVIEPPECEMARGGPPSAARGALLSEAQREAAVLQACRCGDWSDYGWLVGRHRRLVWAAVESVLPGGAGNEDLVQECFVRAFEKLASFRGRSAFSTWLYALARNQARMQRRAQLRRGPQQSLDAEPAEGRALLDRLALVAEPGAGHLDPQVAHFEAARAKAALEILAALPPDCREVLNLFYTCGQSYEEIALALGLPLNTLKSRLLRAKARLRDAAAARGWLEGGS